MRTPIVFSMILLSHAAWAQNAKGIPDDFISKMANDLAGLTTDPLPQTPRGTFASGTASGTLIVPSTVQWVKAGQAWTTDQNTGKAVSRHLDPGTEASVYGETMGHYQVGLGDNKRWWVPVADVTPTGPATRVADTPDPGWLGQQIEKLMKNASLFRDNYKSNPYVNVRGFSINVGIPPSVNMDFEFK